MRIFPTPRRDTTKDRESRLCLLPAPLLPPMGQIEMHFIFEGETCHESRGFSRSLLTDATRDSASVLHHRLYRTDNHSTESSLVNRCAQYLLEEGCDTFCFYRTDESALMNAMSHGNLGCLALLLMYRARKKNKKPQQRQCDDRRWRHGRGARRHARKNLPLG